MRITAIAREDLSNIGNGLVPNKITLELSGKIVPDSYGEHIGRYDVEKEVYESYKSDKKLWEASDVIEDEKKLREAIAHVKYFANNKYRMSLTDKVIESMLLLANATESQLEEVK